jgi:hypothetical protein
MSNLKKAENDIAKILKKNRAYFKYNLTFPVYKILPEEVSLALAILAKHQMHIVVKIVEKK